ncbi:unnamed protein product, partial [Amoebophrya sp. A25]
PIDFLFHPLTSWPKNEKGGKVSMLSKMLSKVMKEEDSGKVKSDHVDDDGKFSQLRATIEQLKTELQTVDVAATPNPSNTVQQAGKRSSSEGNKINTDSMNINNNFPEDQPGAVKFPTNVITSFGHHKDLRAHVRQAIKPDDDEEHEHVHQTTNADDDEEQQQVEYVEQVYGSEGNKYKKQVDFFLTLAQKCEDLKYDRSSATVSFDHVVVNLLERIALAGMSTKLSNGETVLHRAFRHFSYLSITPEERTGGASLIPDGRDPLQKVISDYYDRTRGFPLSNPEVVATFREDLAANAEQTSEEEDVVAYNSDEVAPVANTTENVGAVNNNISDVEVATTSANPNTEEVVATSINRDAGGGSMSVDGGNEDATSKKERPRISSTITAGSPSRSTCASSNNEDGTSGNGTSPNGESTSKDKDTTSNVEDESTKNENAGSCSAESSHNVNTAQHDHKDMNNTCTGSSEDVKTNEMNAVKEEAEVNNVALTARTSDSTNENNENAKKRESVDEQDVAIRATETVTTPEGYAAQEIVAILLLSANALCSDVSAFFCIDMEEQEDDDFPSAAYPDYNFLTGPKDGFGAPPFFRATSAAAIETVFGFLEYVGDRLTLRNIARYSCMCCQEFLYYVLSGFARDGSGCLWLHHLSALEQYAAIFWRHLDVDGGYAYNPHVVVPVHLIRTVISTSIQTMNNDGDTPLERMIYIGAWPLVMTYMCCLKNSLGRFPDEILEFSPRKVLFLRSLRSFTWKIIREVHDLERKLYRLNPVENGARLRGLGVLIRILFE